MNRLEHRAYARLFWEWFIQRPLRDNTCEDIEFRNGRPVAICDHIRFHPQTRNEGTEGDFEYTTCMSYETLNNVTDDECYERVKWMVEHCPSWDSYYRCFRDYRTDQLHEGVWK